MGEAETPYVEGKGDAKGVYLEKRGGVAFADLFSIW